jgi:hypothetical protein
VVKTPGQTHEKSSFCKNIDTDVFAKQL